MKEVFTDRGDDLPNLKLTHGVVAPQILDAAQRASWKLRDAGIPHALAGGLAVGAHGYPRTTDVVDFLVGDEAFEKHEGGFVTLKLPLIAIGNVAIDFVSIDESKGEDRQLRPAVEEPPLSEDCRPGGASEAWPGRSRADGSVSRRVCTGTASPLAEGQGDRGARGVRHAAWRSITPGKSRPSARSPEIRSGRALVALREREACFGRALAALPKYTARSAEQTVRSWRALVALWK